MAKELLAMVGVSVDLAVDGQSGVRAVRSKPYDFVLMDVQMPVIDGYQAVRKIRTEERFKDLPIIAMTAHVMDGDREKCFAAGMNGYVSKPVDPERLYGMLIDVLDLQVPTGAVRRTPDRCAEVSLGKTEERVPDNTAASPLVIPGLDLKQAVRAMGGREDLLVRVLKSFVLDNINATEALQEAVQREEFDAVSFVAHRVKGQAAIIHAEKLRQVSADLELLGKEKNINRCRELSPEFQREFQNVVDSIKSALPESFREKRVSSLDITEVAVTSELHEKLDAFEKLLQENDFAAGEMIETLKEESPEALKGYFQEIDDVVQSLEFDRAHELLCSLRERISA